MVVSAQHFREVTNGFEKRSNGLWTHSGKLVVTGSIDVPDGSIQTADLAGNAATWLAINQGAYSNWSTTTTGWVETPIFGSATFSGAPIRIDCIAGATLSVQGAWYLGWGQDGAISAAISRIDTLANTVHTLSGYVYTNPTAGVHKVSLFVYNAQAGTLTLFNGAPSYVSVMEYRR